MPNGVPLEFPISFDTKTRYKITDEYHDLIKDAVWSSVE